VLPLEHHVKWLDNNNHKNENGEEEEETLIEQTL
jgi:hypothetical protein